MKNLRCKDCQSLKIRIEIKTTAKGTKIAKCECEMCGCMFLKTILSGRKSESDRETGSRRLKQSIAVERLRNSVNKNIEIDYSFKFKTVVTKNIDCTCRVCGRKWVSNYANLIGGYGCLQCSGSMKLTKEEVIKKVKLLANENIIISENFEYKTSVCRNIPCQCRVCGHEWMSSHNALVSGLKCKKCTGSLKKTQKEVVANLKKGASKELKIDYSFKYQNVRAKNIKCTCKKCKKEWFDSYILLVRGRGCIFCRDFKRKKVKNKTV